MQCCCRAKHQYYPTTVHSADVTGTTDANPSDYWHLCFTFTHEIDITVRLARKFNIQFSMDDIHEIQQHSLSGIQGMAMNGIHKITFNRLKRCGLILQQCMCSNECIWVQQLDNMLIMSQESCHGFSSKTPRTCSVAFLPSQLFMVNESAHSLCGYLWSATFVLQDQIGRQRC